MKKSERELVFGMYGGKCGYCGCDLEKGWHVDHIDACRRLTDFDGKVYGFINSAANNITNYMPSCPSCNINKHGMTVEQFRDSIAGFLRSMNLRMVQYKMAKKYGLVEETGRPVIFYFETFKNKQYKP